MLAFLCRVVAEARKGKKEEKQNHRVEMGCWDERCEKKVFAFSFLTFGSEHELEYCKMLDEARFMAKISVTQIEFCEDWDSGIRADNACRTIYVCLGMLRY